MDLNKVGKFIANLRKEKGLTQSELGDLVGVTDKTVSKWERGIHAPDIAILTKLSNCLDISVTELLHGKRLRLDKRDINVESIKFYNKISKLKYVKFSIFIILLIIIAFLSIFMINNYNRFKVYRITSEIEDFTVNGYVIFNRDKNIIVINKIEYIDKYIGTDKEIKVKSVDMFLKCDNKVLYSVGDDVITDNQNLYYLSKYINDKFLYIDENIEQSEYILSTDSNINKLSIEITYIDGNNQEHILNIPLKAQKEISNTKLFY